MLTLTFRLLRYSSTLSALKPLGEGRTDTPINRRNRGEVPQTLLNPNIDLEPRLAHHTEKGFVTMPSPFGVQGRTGGKEFELHINNLNVA